MKDHASTHEWSKPNRFGIEHCTDPRCTWERWLVDSVHGNHVSARLTLYRNEAAPKNAWLTEAGSCRKRTTHARNK